MIGNLYFKRSNGEKVLIKENLAEDKLSEAIKAAVAEMNPNYEIYYTRCWKSPNDPATTVYDVGSHSEFFLYTETSGE